jgi:hypothetical protein
LIVDLDLLFLVNDNVNVNDNWRLKKARQHALVLKYYFESSGGTKPSMNL